MMKFKNKKLALFVSLACISILASHYLVFAQSSPQFMISWRAASYIPADYQGKIFPNKSSLIEVGFDLIDGNKVADLSKNTIRWYLDNNNLASGQGLKTASFNASQAGDNDYAVRISVINYKGNDFEQTLTIPIVRPEVVLDAKTTSKLISIGSNTIKALPYFFNVKSVKNLSFEWSRNSQKIEGIAENPDFLNLNIQSQGQPAIATPLNISVMVKNVLNQLELAIKNLNLIVK